MAILPSINLGTGRTATDIAVGKHHNCAILDNASVKCWGSNQHGRLGLGNNNTITLTWNSVSGATSYTLYWGNVSGIDSSDTAITSITNDNYTHSSLDNGAIYYYKVAAVDSSGTGTSICDCSCFRR